MTEAFNHLSMAFWLTRQAELAPSRVALDFEDRLITYDELEARSARAAAALEALGVSKGDRVAALSDNRPEYLEVFFACARLGAVLAPVSWRLTESEIAWQLEDSEPAVLLTSNEWSETAERVFDGPRLAFGGDETSYEEVLSGAPGIGAEDRSTFEDPLMILYTSGTTGRPKGAVLTHGNFFWANLNMLVGADLIRDEVSLVFLPMFHIGGWNINTLAVFLKGGTVVLERQFDPARVLELIGKKRVTLLMGVPATYLFMSQVPGFDEADFSSVRLMVVGGAPMPQALLDTYAARGIDVVQGYGLTELAPNALLLPVEDVRDKVGSAGKPYFFTDTRLVDEAGDFVEKEGVGEVVARGPVVMKEYWRRPEATQATIREGWLRTGDVARKDEEGFFFIVDRVKDMIITGGENVYPAEVEDVLYRHPTVGEAAVIGIPDESWGESVHAIVVPQDGLDARAEDIIEHCKRDLASFKVPRSIEIRGEPLPRTPAGKVRKPELRAPYWEGREERI